MGKTYHVSAQGSNRNQGDENAPFRTISRAAEVMEAGDRVIVHEGTYREWVKPARGGKNELSRIVYEAAPGEKVVIKGSEEVSDWEKVQGTVWKAVIPNRVFGDYNPYAVRLQGDWYLYPEYPLHTGEVYINGKSMYEADSLDSVKNPMVRTEGMSPSWAKHVEKISCSEDTVYQWYSVVDDENTTIYANFQKFDPRKEKVEINVRESCFYPRRKGIDFITVKGFEMAHAATRWAPPTADQQGLIGPRWSKGWIIQNNTIHDSKCIGISIGRDEFLQDKLESEHLRKSGHQYQLEAVFYAENEGWTKEHIGSHLICDNTIYNCGQDGIGGNLGCIFSKIVHNHIYNIGIKHEFFGHEIAGIKLHTAIDTEICDNWIHNCTLGTWMDWQAQGVRIHRNLYERNDRDLMIEVTHGPHIVDNNIFASDYNLDNMAQGGAYIHNLFCGTMYLEKQLDRATPYHFAHSTKVKGYAVVYGGDDRFYNNVFVGGTNSVSKEFVFGTAGYQDHPQSFEEYLREIDIKSNGHGHVRTFTQVKQPVYLAGNIYLNGAVSCGEKDCKCIDIDPNVRIEEEGESVYCSIDIPETMREIEADSIDSNLLGTVRLVEEGFQDPNGNKIQFDHDYTGIIRDNRIFAGPFQKLKSGENRILIWHK